MDTKDRSPAAKSGASGQDPFKWWDNFKKEIVIAKERKVHIYDNVAVSVWAGLVNRKK